ncbi:hypothetical protein DMN91_008426 [Ooceraea biroi]|uniref:Protein phosphatase 1D n=1 Tax=Ooceraea biroi TaxID=2015173 RepID=A0A026WVK5_OOCBI|nr:uncharacterized protein LOC105274835 [Ooceraea biroi]XP_011329583.1 uncharacterized protein LOC105274835 [Ooceraea biroi]EZA60023.1 Protein phosphatase 1D [Ooceraea biroi]RLU19867.1 hypothetical protein DMN91_008426 [Ooceraea biroi]
MPLSIGVNLRVTGHCNQGGRKYMEDMFCVAFQPTPDDKDLEYAFFGIFDGHGGGEAATFAKEHLMDIIVKQKNFWSDRDEDVLRAIRDGYMNTHYAMWRELDKWPRTASGLPSTAGTTASIAFIRKGKIYIGHVGDSAIILGYQVEGDPQWRAKALTKDHKPESGPEMTRIQESGGKVVSKSGVPRVVWNRPRIGHKGPVRRSTHMDEIPFLAVARSLGDLWSYNSELNTFVVSPEPDVKVIPVDVKSHRCLIFGTDGLWNMLSPQAAVAIVQATDRHNEKHLIASQQTGSGVESQMWINPSKSLVDRALERWSSTRLRADNTSVVTLMLDPSGPCRGEVLFNQKKDRVIHHGTNTTAVPANVVETSPKVPAPCAPIPPPSASTNVDIDPKQPDSSNGSEEITDETSQSETAVNPEKLTLSEIDVPSDQDTATDKNIEANDVAESIQVDEVSSSQMFEETGESENKKANEVADVTSENLDDEKQRTAKQEKETVQLNNDNTQVPVESDPKSCNHIEPKDETADKTEESNVAQQNAPSNANEEVVPFMSRLLRSGGVVPLKSNSFDGGEVRNILNGLRHKPQHPLFAAARANDRTIKRRHSLNSSQASQNTFPDAAPNPEVPKTYMSVKSRYSRISSAKTSVVANVPTEEKTKGMSSKRTNGDCTVGSKRRYSAITQASVASVGVENGCAQQEPCVKRRTRSEDRRQSPTDENDPANQAKEDASSRLSWPTSDGRSDSTLPSLNSTTTTLSGQDKLSASSTFERRSLGKKVTPVKAIRRPSINGTGRLQQLRGSFGLRDWDQGRNNRANGCSDRRTLNRTVAIIGPDTTIPQRWLRSDTMAATPVKTLRSRNVDIAGHTISAQLVHQYGVVKQNRLPLPGKLKQSNSGALQSNRVRSSSLSSNKLKQASSNGGSVSTCAAINTATTGSTSGIAKRVKSPYNPSARSLSTRSRIKRLGK